MSGQFEYDNGELKRMVRMNALKMFIFFIIFA